MEGLSEIVTMYLDYATRIAKIFAKSEFEKYRVIQDSLYKSDFDKLMEESDIE